MAAAQRYYPTGVLGKELLGISAGTTSFYGDLEGTSPIIGSNPHFGLTYEYKVHPYLGLRASGLWYKISATDADATVSYTRDRNLSFTSSNLEISVLAAAYLLPYRPAEFSYRKKFNAYGLVGLGATLFRPQAWYGGEKWDLRSMRTEGVTYSRVAVVVPFGGGIQYQIAPQLDLVLQATYHYSFTDYLDDCSTRYIDQSLFENEIAAGLADRRSEVGLERESAGAIRGNPNVKDSYAMISLRMQYYLLRYQFRGREIKKLYQ